ncbi:necrosis inducing-like protein NPP1 type [Phytophthora sojae]|uniref:Necrosis inducing-like protein NPP1 type n=1 Tax=Phytophthora sojae (strain P6497) TaxID=1094619 RepID=G4Z583_PHYSP|nr:necrosis inducing-like protein NPP1 type [Phytophthora sojae]EGZ20226.1 necrosis inducing-like protein NPP1 type [Phytophthora sojae]|eukprot:XP_009522943.1 necrosis inducing-like protein NPP1 type [Phytophthora sojae]
MSFRALSVTIIIVLLKPIEAGIIDHDQVVPFPQSQPTTITNKAALKLKPRLFINNGCHLHPAVNANGDTSGGLKPKGSPEGGCRGSGSGSQVYRYGRSTWYNGVWAIMYAWYFPKDEPTDFDGHRHDWEHVIVRINNPVLENPTILAMTPSAHSGYSTYAPPPADMVSGTSCKVEYTSSWIFIDHHLEGTSTAGETQDLIMWSDLTDAARYALSTTNFGKADTPMNNGTFNWKLSKAWPWP